MTAVEWAYRSQWSQSDSSEGWSKKMKLMKSLYWRFRGSVGDSNTENQANENGTIINSSENTMLSRKGNVIVYI